MRHLVLLLCIFIFAGCQGQKTETADTTATPSVTVSQTQTGTEGVEKDNMALNFSLSDMTGKTFDLHSFRGKKAVHIVFWSSG
jgi:cytochrome oxidase Cu insertion factor (SCO1/SenC/PrrC family)